MASGGRRLLVAVTVLGYSFANSIKTLEDRVPTTGESQPKATKRNVARQNRGAGFDTEQGDKSMLQRIARAGVPALVAAALFVGPALAGKKDDTLNIEWDQPIDNADAYYNTNREGILLARMVWDQLIERDPVTFEYKPELATAWRWVDDVTLEFDLRQGVKFQDGQPFDADDVVFTLNFVSNSANKVLNTTNVGWIKNAEKIDQYKVRIHLKAPFPPALEYVSGPLPIYPHVYYAKVGPEGMGKKPIGSGPYKVEALEPGKSVTLVKNTEYWDGSPKGKPKIGKIVERFIPEKTTQIAELLSGGLDWMWYVPTDQVANIKKVKGLIAVDGETMRVGYIFFDAAARSGKSPLQDVRVRRAIAYAINREQFTKTFFAPSAHVLKAPCFPTQFGCYQDATQYDFDLEKAKALLKEAGYPNGFKTELYGFRQPRSWEDALAGYMRAIGVSANIQLLEYPTFRNKNHEGVTPVSFGDWGSYSVNDASAILGNFFTGSLDDFTGDKELQQWVNEADANPDAKRRQELYQKAIARIMDQMYMLPMNSYAIYYAYTSDLDFTPFRDEIPRYYLYSWK
jgi:peptide/nickel transport system substrate-binding protein